MTDQTKLGGQRDPSKRLDDLRALLLKNDCPHVSDIYDLLGPEMTPGEDRAAWPITQIRRLTDRFVAGFMSVEEYDRDLRGVVGVPGRGAPIR